MDSYGYCYQNPIKFVDPTGMEGDDWYRDKSGLLQYDPHVKSQADLSSDETYIGTSYSENTSRGTANYRNDGSILYSDERDAYQRIWINTFARQREQLGIIGDNSVLVLPDYKNTLAGAEYAAYGYSFKNGNLIDATNGKSFNTLATVHVHPSGGGPSTYSNKGYGDLSFAMYQTPDKPVFVFQNQNKPNGQNSISYIIAAPNPERNHQNIKYYINNLTRQFPEINVRTIRSEYSLIGISKRIPTVK